MIISGKYYPTQDLTNNTGKSSEVDSLTALRSFFGESEEDTKSSGLSDKVDISAKALSVLEDYVKSSGSKESESLLSYIKGKAQDKFLGNYEPKSALAELSGAMQSYGNKELAEVYERVKEANQQLSDSFIATASRYGVQSLL